MLLSEMIDLLNRQLLLLNRHLLLLNLYWWRHLYRHLLRNLNLLLLRRHLILHDIHRELSLLLLRWCFRLLHLLLPDFIAAAHSLGAGFLFTEEVGLGATLRWRLPTVGKIFLSIEFAGSNFIRPFNSPLPLSIS